MVGRWLERVRGNGRPAHDAALAACMGVVGAYGHPGIELTLLTPVSLISLAMLAARARSLFGAARVGVAFGIGIASVITVSAREWAYIVPVALTLLGTALFALPLALWAQWSARRNYGIAAFVATIAARALCLDLSERLGFPTNGEGLWAISCVPLMMAGARWVGSNVISGVMAAGFIGTGISLARLRSFDARGVWAAAVPVLASGAGLVLTSGLVHLTAAPSLRSINVGVPQMNVPASYASERMTSPGVADAFEDTFARQVRALGDVDLLALTETYDDAFPLQVPRIRRRFENHARLQHQAVLLSSYLVAADGGILNSVGGIDDTGKLVGVHRKVDLAPFGEVEYEHGEKFEPLPVLPGVRVGVLICQESMLPNGARRLAAAGANLLVGPTSDISFGSGELVFEHLAGARIRAVETGRALLWASAGGPSGAIDRWGVFERRASFRTPGAAISSVALHDEVTFYTRSVWFWPPLCALVLLALLIRLSRWNVAEPEGRGSATPIGTIRGMLELTFAFAFVAAASIASPAAIELVNGTPERAKQSVLDLIHGGKAARPGSFARFRSDPEHTDQGAAAYFLEAYGQRTAAVDVTFSSTPRSVSELARELETFADFPTREVTIDFTSPQRAHMLVQAKSGQFCVTRSDRAKRIWLFVPATAQVFALTVAEAAMVLEPTGLLPTQSPVVGYD